MFVFSVDPGIELRVRVEAKCIEVLHEAACSQLRYMSMIDVGVGL